MTVWFVSDTHFWHGNILRFTGSGGSLIRPGFDSVEEMNELMIQRWNSRVSPGDKVYHLGDVSMAYGQKLSEVMTRLNGKKRLILGNHDRLKGTNLDRFFERVILWRVFGAEGFFCTHVPSLEFPHSCSVNVHGHIHRRAIPDERYVNVSVEMTDYSPVSMDEIIAKVRHVRKEDG